MTKQSWKFLIIGITGDLSKRKILPALSEFATLNREKVEIELHGYSRSLPDEEEIQKIIGEKSAIKNIIYAQGEYSDPKYFQSLTENLKPEERLVVYFAVPPIVFLDLLETFCPYYKANLDIIIEKPFGRDGDEAQKILAKIRDCKLEENVHFCDHYLFKEAADLTGEAKSFLQDFLKEKEIKSFEIKALEKVDVKGRGGYYDEIGAIKDMFPAHIFSLYELVFENILGKKIESKFNINKVKLGQYKDYKNHVEKSDSQTETYFKIEGSFDDGINFTFESGKNLAVKLTEITVTFADGEKIIWNIDPEKTIQIDGKIFNLSHKKVFDHTNMFEAILEKKNEKFFKNENTLLGWKSYEEIKNFIEEKKINLEEY